ncbi:MAG: hypothetical protein PT941_01805 [Bacillales bacterium]|nr:hypothetical protein [Bacillales bacterium]
MKKKNLFTLSVACLATLSLASCGGKGPDLTGVNDAADYIWQMYKNESASVKTANTDSFNLVTKVTIEGVIYDVTWTVNQTGGVENAVSLGGVENSLQQVVVNYGIDNEVETPFTLTAKITDEKGNEATKVFERYVPAFAFSSYKDFSKADGKTVYNVKGIITQKSSSLSSGKVKNLWLQNDDCGILAYNLICENDEAFKNDLKIGNEIVVSGTVTNYNGQLEFQAGCTYKVTSTATATPKYVDATEAFKKATNEKDKSLDIYQNRLVEIKDVTIANINADSYYYYFEIGGIKTYLRTSTSYGMTSDQCSEVVKDWVQGYKANIKGLCVVYSNVYYIQPVDTNAVTITERVLSDETKVENAVKDVQDLIGSEIVKNSSITLPANASNENYSDVTYAWSVTEGASNFVIENGKLKVTVGATPVQGKVKVVATLNGKTSEHIFEVTAKLPDVTTIADFIKNKDKNTVQYLKGTVVAYGGTSDKAGSFVLADETGVVFSYNKIVTKVGDEVIIATTYDEYSYLVQSKTTELVATVSTGNDISSYLANPVVMTTTELLADITAKADDAAMYEAYGQKCMKITGIIKATDKGYAMYVNESDSSYVVNVYADTELSNTIKALIGESTSANVTLTGFVRGISSSYDSITVQTTAVVAAE